MGKVHITVVTIKLSYVAPQAIGYPGPYCQELVGVSNLLRFLDSQRVGTAARSLGGVSFLSQVSSFPHLPANLEILGYLSPKSKLGRVCVFTSHMCCMCVHMMLCVSIFSVCTCATSNTYGTK